MKDPTTIPICNECRCLMERWKQSWRCMGPSCNAFMLSLSNPLVTVQDLYTWKLSLFDQEFLKGCKIDPFH